MWLDEYLNKYKSIYFFLGLVNLYIYCTIAVAPIASGIGVFLAYMSPLGSSPVMQQPSYVVTWLIRLLACIVICHLYPIEPLGFQW